jgi:hypothetical protein
MLEHLKAKRENKEVRMTKPRTSKVKGQIRKSHIVKFRKNFTKGNSRANKIPEIKYLKRILCQRSVEITREMMYNFFHLFTPQVFNKDHLYRRHYIRHWA